MDPNSAYTDLKGRVYGLATLAPDELKVIRFLQDFSARNPDWFEYRNYYMAELIKFGDSRGLTRRETMQTTAWRVAQDLAGRIAIAAGFAKQSDYRSELEILIHTKFRTRRDFCEATGLSEDMLSHVLARRKNLAIDTLADALAKIGYAIHFAPMPNVK